MKDFVEAIKWIDVDLLRVMFNQRGQGFFTRNGTQN
jgi:hypothetical protein